MKKIIFLGTLLFLIVLTGIMLLFYFIPDANCSQSAPTIGWWKCNEGTGSNLADSANNNNAVTLYNASWVSGEPKFDKCIQVIPTSYGLTNLAGQGMNGKTAVTISFWVYFLQANNVDGTAFMYNYDGSPYCSFYFYFYSPDKVVTSWIDNGAAHDCTNNTNYAWTLNTWHNVVIAYLQGGTNVTYVDGTLVKSVSAATMTGGLCPTNDKHIFSYYNGTYGIKSGYYAEVKIDGSQWTQTDVTNEWNTNYTPATRKKRCIVNFYE